MTKTKLIELIKSHLLDIGYRRNTNFELYSVGDLLKVCSLYGIDIKDKTT